MLFSYCYVPHSIERFQIWLDHLVKEVWCKATGDFTIDLLHEGLRQIVLIIADDNTTKLKLFEPIRDIFDLFKSLTDDQRVQFGKWHDANNNIEALCGNLPDQQPITYAEVALINGELAEHLKAFYNDIWGRVLDLQAVKKKIGTIDEHYRAFVKENNEDRCPYCGYGYIKGQYQTKREAYDHFLPKGTYPFNSVNFRNLAPICYECNSSYKLARDPTRHLDPISRRNTGQRRKAFYSYATVSPDISISLTLKTTDIDKLRPIDIELAFTAPGRGEELEAWKEVFGIEERFKAKCCGKNDGKYWLRQVIDECINAGKTAQEILNKIKENARATPWAECNFLKSPFLQACDQAGLIQ